MRLLPRLLTASGALVLIVACQGDRRPDGTPDAATPESATGRPVGWEVRLDQAGDDPSAVEFRGDEHGYVVHTGPAAILFNPALSVADEFHAEARMAQTTPTAHAEAYGLFVGGKDLQSVVQSYVYFLIRQDGKFLIKRRVGAETMTLVDWTAHPALVRAEEGADALDHTLRIDAGPDTVTFSINGQQVASLPRSDVDVDGIVGFRVNHGLEVSITHFEVVPGVGAPERATPESRSSSPPPLRPATAG